MVAEFLASLLIPVCGFVFNAEEQPIANATVKFQAQMKETQTDSHGRFCLDKAANSNVISAWQQGYFIKSQVVTEGEEPKLILQKIPPNIASKNESWQWLHSLHSEVVNASETSSDFQPCEQCHQQTSNEWKSSGHSGFPESGNFKLFKQLDIPQAQCNLCHAPLKMVNNTDGISCDYCHKINDVDMSNSLLLGSQQIHHYLPEQGQLFFAQLKDVARANDSFHPLYERSEYCAACHEGRFWKTPVYSDFSEWQDSAWAQEGVQCQNCHMDGTREYAAGLQNGGILRAPDTLANHQFLTVKSDVKTALEIESSLTESGDELLLTIVIENTGAGHKVPAGNPMRHLILKVDSSEANSAIKGNKIPRWVNDESVGQPGIAFGKILAPQRRYGKTQDFGLYPAPFWINNVLESDNRLKPKEKHTEVFRIPKIAGISITIQLSLREYFANWLDLPEPDEILLYSEQLTYQ